MSTTLTIRNLDEAVKQKLRIRAAQHGRSMEAEARAILSRDVMGADLVESSPIMTTKGKIDHLVGLWKGRMSTDEIMNLTRGGDVIIDERDGVLIMTPVDANSWPEDLETRFQILGDLEIPARPKDSKPVNF